MTMKKIFMYQFMPSKAQEEACKARNIPWKVTRRIVEIRDIYSAPIIDPRNPWQIHKVVTQFEQTARILVLPFADTFDHVFRYWMKGMVQWVTTKGKSQCVELWDVTEENHPKNDECAYVKRMPSEDYALVCANLFAHRGLTCGDEIGLYWDPDSSNFKFKLMKKSLI